MTWQLSLSALVRPTNFSSKGQIILLRARCPAEQQVHTGRGFSNCGEGAGLQTIIEERPLKNMKERITVLGQVTWIPAWTLLADEFRDFELDEFPYVRIEGRNRRRQIDRR